MTSTELWSKHQQCMLCGHFTHFLLCIFGFLLSTFNYLQFSLFPCPSSFFLPSLVSPAFRLCEKAARSLIRVPCNWAVFLILLLKHMGNDCQVWWEEVKVQLSLCINTTAHSSRTSILGTRPCQHHWICRSGVGCLTTLKTFVVQSLLGYRKRHRHEENIPG